MADPTMSPEELWEAYAQNGAAQEPVPMAPENQAASEEQMLAQQPRKRRKRRVKAEQRPVPNMAMVREKLACNQAELDRIRQANQQGLLGLGQAGPQLPFGLDFKSVAVGIFVGGLAVYFFGPKRSRA